MEQLTHAEVAALRLQINQLNFVLETNEVTIKNIENFLNLNGVYDFSETVNQLQNCKTSKVYLLSHLETLNNLLNEQ